MFPIILVILIGFSTVSFADSAPKLGDEYQAELPLPPAFPLNFKNIDADNEKSKSQKEEDRERYDPKKTQIGERVRQDAQWSTDYEVDLSGWDRSSEGNSWSLNWELVGLVILGTMGSVLIILFVLFLLRIKFKKKDKKKVGETESIIAHLESVTQNQAHEKLAITGDFNIAVHALLLDVLRAIFRADPEMERPSVTAREIQSSFEEPEICVDLGPLIQVVEWSRFADRPATEADYLDLRPRCDRLIAIFEERAWRNENSNGEGMI